MVPRKLQVSETFHSISKSWNGICDESRSLVFVNFLESRIFELFVVKSRIFKQGLGVSASLKITIQRPLYVKPSNKVYVISLVTIGLHILPMHLKVISVAWPRRF